MKNKDIKKLIKDSRMEAGKLMTKAQMIKCNIAIHTAAVASGVCGAVPIPIADAIPIGAAQVAMVIAIGNIFGQKISGSTAKGMLGAVATSTLGRAAVKLIPLAGWVVSATVAAGITEAYGWYIAAEIARGFRKEWEGQKNAKEAADAYSEAEYYKRAKGLDKPEEETEDISEE